MNVSMPLPVGSILLDKLRVVYAPDIGYLGNGQFLTENSVPCYDCCGEKLLTPLQYAIAKMEGKVSMVKLGVRSRVTELLSVKVHEILYEGTCEKCGTSLRIVSVVNMHSCDESVSASVV